MTPTQIRELAKELIKDAKEYYDDTSAETMEQITVNFLEHLKDELNAELNDLLK